MTTLRKIFIFCILSVFIVVINHAFPQAVKGGSTRMHSIRLKKEPTPGTASNDNPIIVFASLLPYEASGIEVKSAYDQIKEIDGYSTRYLTFKELTKLSKKSGQFSVIWIHRPDTAAFTPGETTDKLLKFLRDYVENGGKLFLTLQASHYLNFLGFEPSKLQDSTKSCVDDGYGRRLGFHAFRDHPLFTGLNGGVYVCRPSQDIKTSITGFFRDHLPEQGKVVAVDWDYIFLREDSKLVLEYTPAKGKVIAVGGYMDFSLPNSNAAHLTMFTQNCLNYLLGQYEGQPEYYWNYSPGVVMDCPPRPETDQLLVAVSPAEKWEEQPDEYALQRRFAGEHFWDVAGERLLTMGVENRGIEEVWAHPFMAFRDYEVGIRFSYKDSIFWLSDERPEIEVHPAFFQRQYKFTRAYLKELIVNDPSEPNGVIHYEYRGVYPATLIVKFKSNLRWMWPYSERVTGSVCHSWDYDLDAMTIQDQSGDLNLVIGGTKKPVQHLSGQFDGFKYNEKDSSFHGIPTGKLQVAGLLSYDLSMNDNLDVVFSASSEGFNKTYSQFNKTIHEPAQIYRNALEHSRNILSKNLMITTPDRIFNTGYRWAMIATDRFFVNTPGMGKALVAGYSTTRHGWDGGHKINGRPGYGWYFGRDAQWSSFALLDYGDFTKVKSQLEFFNKYQDLNGKIFHEASASGVIHYDAADATPLYVVLAGKYFRHTNDTAFLQETWPNIKRAINFCFSTDTDFDHLIENTNVGHGWVEGGELYGSHATIYMAGAWGAALTEASNMARYLKDPDAESYLLEGGIQHKIIDNDFWNDQQQFFAYGKNKDGTFRREQTILPAVPIYFGLADREKATITLKNIAGNAFTTNWGARILREDSPWFKPTGYHYGSVWPLFTGWASLAEYATGNPIQGFSHLMNNLNGYRNWGLGFVEEVLNGAEYKPSGVCAHQCWSETMVLQPAIEGMLGMEISAQENTIFLAPQFPPQWDTVSVQNISMADQLVDMQFTRSNGVCRYQFSLNSGNPVRITFMPGFAAGTKFTRVMLDGKPVQFTSFKSDQSMTINVSFTLNQTSNLIVETEGGISVLPVVLNPKPGDAAEGFRILSTFLSESLYQVETEGKSGSSDTLEFWSGEGKLLHAENARFLDQTGNIYRFSVDFDRSESKYVTKTITINLK
ncbi:MAG: GH116 family glycosyl hydrolase [Bacteroidales bacterium]|nr:GH116 family glycosyl hydrolase [Bacteroidales bacterium]